MAAKNLAIREEGYRKPVDAKTDEESFSDIIDRLLSTKQKLSSFSGTFAGDQEFLQVGEDRRRVRTMSAPHPHRA
jgi:predicted CopG family antitoxin